MWKKNQIKNKVNFVSLHGSSLPSGFNVLEDARLVSKLAQCVPTICSGTHIIYIHNNYRRREVAVACLSDFFLLHLLRVFLLFDFFSLVLHAFVIFPMVRYLSPTAIIYPMYAQSSIVPPFSSAAVFPSMRTSWCTYIIYLFARKPLFGNLNYLYYTYDNDIIIIRLLPTCTCSGYYSVLSNFAPGMRYTDDRAKKNVLETDRRSYIGTITIIII